MAYESSDLEPNLEAWAAEELKVLETLGVSSRQLASSLAREIDGISRVDATGIRHPPDQFNISLNSDDASKLASTWNTLQSAMGDGLRANLQATGFQVTRRLHISFSTDPMLGRGSVQVIAWHSGDPLKMEDRPDVEPESSPRSGRPDAFLVVGGTHIFRLQADEVAIGRSLDNDLVIDNPRVSRRHSLIQSSGGQFSIQDLHSTAGTQVNGRRVRSEMLHPGDVIRLAETELVYGESPGEPPTQAAPYQGPLTSAAGPQQVTSPATTHHNAPVTERLEASKRSQHSEG